MKRRKTPRPAPEQSEPAIQLEKLVCDHIAALLKIIATAATQERSEPQSGRLAANSKPIGQRSAQARSAEVSYGYDTVR